MLDVANVGQDGAQAAEGIGEITQKTAICCSTSDFCAEIGKPLLLLKNKLEIN